MTALALGAVLMVPSDGWGQVRRQEGGRGPARGGAGRQMGEAIAQILNLTEQQRPRFAEVTGRFTERERSLNDEERVARLSMRNLLCSGDSTRGAELARALDQVLDVQKRRHQLIEEQQKELSAFLTPYQRARFLGSREIIMDRMGMGRGRGGRAGPPPQGGLRQGGPPPGQEGQGRRGGPPPDMCAAPPGPQDRRPAGR